jgi:hypothetical protein
MTKKIKTSEILAAYNTLNSAKYGSMEDADKIKVWKITRALKPVATKFDEDSKDAAEKMKPKDKDFDEKMQKAQEYERMIHDPKADASKLPMGAAEYDEFIKKVWQPYNKLVNDTIKESANKEVKVSFEPLNDDAFGKLMSSNEWTMGQAVALSEIICEGGEVTEVEEPKEKKKK